MEVGRIVRLSVVGVGLSVAAVASAAEDSTLADAAETGRTTLVRTLLDSGADVNGAQVDGMTALHWAVYHNDSVTASLLMQSGATSVRRTGMA
jgi:ankyrin repeat protein